jgi:hypothetical protein
VKPIIVSESDLEILKTPEACGAARDLQALLVSGRSVHEISVAEADAIYRRNGLHGATRQVVAEHLFDCVIELTNLDALNAVGLATIERIRVLLGASRT